MTVCPVIRGKAEKLLLGRKVYTGFSSCSQTRALPVLGVTFQGDYPFTTHVRTKLIKADKSLFILRSLRKEGYTQAELDHLFQSLVIPNLTYGLSVYGALNAELTTVQCFLDRCHMRTYISKAVNIFYDLLEKQGRKMFDKVKHQEKHPLRNVMPKLKNTEYNLKHKSSHRPKLNTDRVKNSYFNRLIFKYDLTL